MNTHPKNDNTSKQDTVRYSEELSFELRKGLVDEYYEKFKKSNPHLFEENFVMPKPQKAKSLSNVNLDDKQMAQVPIGELQKSVFCGSILADSSFGIQARYKSPRAQNRHSTRQKEWFFWKWLCCLVDFHNGLSSITVQNSDGYQKKTPLLPNETFLGKIKVTTKVHSPLTALYKALPTRTVSGKANKVKIERYWLNHMTNYFLLTLWLDDGGLTQDRQGVISLNSTPKKELEILADYLKTVWGIQCYVEQASKKKMKNGNYPHHIRISTQTDLVNLLRIIAPIVPVREMLYKIKFAPLNNSDLLQRWASEVPDLVLPEFRDNMRDFYSKVIENNKCRKENQKKI